MHQISVDIVCPKCSGKALFKTEPTGTCKRYPNIRGFVSCTDCGLNVEHAFSNQDYYCHIAVGGRKLFARNLDNLILLRDFFTNGYKTKPNRDPEFDFSREFYQNKEVIVKRINRLLEDGQGYSRHKLATIRAEERLFNDCSFLCFWIAAGKPMPVQQQVPNPWRPFVGDGAGLTN